MLSRSIYFYVIMAFLFVVSVVFVNHNDAFYDRPIAEVTKVKQEDKTEVTDQHHNTDELFTQQITAKLKNGEAKGETIHLQNEYSASGAYDQAYQPGNDLFVSLDTDKGKNATLTGKIIDVKRDKYVLVAAWVFVAILLIVGKRQGLFSIIALAINAMILSYALDIYVKNSDISLLFLCSISVVLFTAISLLFLHGLNEKTYAAIVATLLGTFLSLLIASVVIWATSESGLRYEEMQFLTRPYQVIFIASLFLGSLGGVMDIAITMTSSIFGLYEKNNAISKKALQTSGMEIGKDIMGTITNILLLVYISGSIPMLILYLNNGSALTFSLTMNLSLEVARALAGGIGIVLSIPVSLYTSIFFINRKRAKS
ncbi:YibE/F family protein [Virgibacillus alimentarius]|uniref:YibE/F family protein n=1 Tax=Virgibacillus alimentarius TaxID=698769 RepID=UPI00049335DC|nr:MULTISPECIES: YibE/F family protein [Virgibacillus]HLR66630.1 YibE/F family protein [Virgibacillus sp.]